MDRERGVPNSGSSPEFSLLRLFDPLLAQARMCLSRRAATNVSRAGRNASGAPSRGGTSSTPTGSNDTCSSSVRGTGACIGRRRSSLDVLCQHLGRMLRSKAFRVNCLSQGRDILVLSSHLLSVKR